MRQKEHWKRVEGVIWAPRSLLIGVRKRMNPDFLDFATTPKASAPKGEDSRSYAFLTSTTSSLTLCSSHPSRCRIISNCCLRMPRQPAAKYDNGNYYSNNQNAAPYPQPQSAAAYMDPQQIVPVIQDPISKKKHVCPTCDRTFTTSGHLARHARVHTGEKNHQCPFPNCKTRCSRQDNLQQQ
jgi:uncharacterized Zn-finger protein